MKKKSILLRCAIILMCACTYSTSSYGQNPFSAIRNVYNALTKPYVSVPGVRPVKVPSIAEQYRPDKERAAQERKEMEDWYKFLKKMTKENEEWSKRLRNKIAALDKAKREKKLREAKLRQFHDSYKRTCAGLEQGKVLRDTLYWIRLYNEAVILKEDSIAKDCLTRFLSYNPSVPIIVAADSLIPSNDRYAPAIPAISTELKFYEYWQRPDSATITSSDFATLATLGEKHNSNEFYVNLARGMRDYLNGNYKSASDIFMNLFEYEIDFPHFKPEYKRLLSNITAYTLDCAGCHADMLAFFEKWEDTMLTPGPYYDVKLSDLLVTENPFTTFLLYKAAVCSPNPQDIAKAEKYMNMCKAADAEYFDAQYKQFYDGVYAHFLDNPQYLENLDFIIAGFAPDYMSDNLTILMSDLIDKLPDSPDDGTEHYYEESLAPYREAILEIAHRADSLHNGRFTPQNAIAQSMAEITRTGYLSSAQQGRENLKKLFERLYKKRKATEYNIPLVLTGAIYSQILSYRQPKDAAKIMDKILPVMDDTANRSLLNDTKFLEDTYEYAADLYRKINKPKKADKMLRNAANLHTGVVE